MEFIRKNTALTAIIAFIVGLIIGLPILGWWLWPVQFTDATPAQLAPEFQDAYLRMVAELYSFGGNAEMVQQSLSGWVDTSGNPVSGVAAACDLAATSGDPAEVARLEAIATVINPGGCTAISAEPTEEGGGIPWLPILLLLLLIFIVIAILFLLSRRNAASEFQPQTTITSSPSTPSNYQSPPGTTGVTPVDEEISTIPLARDQTTYTRGNDNYDYSISIQSENQEFLGECGVGIAESIGTEIPRRVTAFEIWLFDKNDIRTITKVIMSDHAFFDEALKAKLATKGDPLLARENETIVLETAALIINAEVTDMVYATDPSLPQNSAFDRFTVEVSAWAKDGTPNPTTDTGSASDQLDF